MRSVYSIRMSVVPFFIFLVFISFYVFFLFGCERNFLVELVFLVIMLHSVFFALFALRPLMQVYFSFSYVFFGLAPLVQYRNNVVFSGPNGIWESGWMLAGLVVVLCNFIMIYAYRYAIQRQIIYALCDANCFRINETIVLRRYYKYRVALLIFLSFVSCFVTFYFHSFSFMALLWRGGVADGINFSSTVILLSQPIQLLPFAGALLYKLYFPEKKAVFYVLFVCVLFCTFPTGVSRFQAAAIYISLLVASFPSILMKARLPMMLIFGVLFLFPMMDVFRVYTDHFSFKAYGWFEEMESRNFDSFQSIVDVLDLGIITWGRQLVGVLLFFVPRNIWPEKPIGSGAFMAEVYGLSFTNVSANYFAEGYINFGFLGLVLFAVILGLVLGYLDSDAFKYGFAFKRIIFVYLIGYLFFLMRGDLMSSFSYLIAFVVPVYFVYRLIIESNGHLYLFPKNH